MPKQAVFSWRYFPKKITLINNPLFKRERCARPRKETCVSLIFTHKRFCSFFQHYNGVIMGAIASQIPSPTIVFSTAYLDTDQRKHQSSASLAFVRGIHRRPMNSPHKWPVTRKMFPFDDVIMVQARVPTKFRLITSTSNFVVIITLADDLTPLCTRASTDALMAQFSTGKIKFGMNSNGDGFV